MCRWWSKRAWATTGKRRINAPFHDHFSNAAVGYAQSRPTYPEALFRHLADLAPARERAWDCATGSGQAALGLARHFDRVEATDASAQQIAHATPMANVAYSVQPAESTTFGAASFDAVCVAQALHWFDVERFYAEVKRLLRPRGVVLVVGYGWMEISPELDPELERAVIEPLRPYWPSQNRLLWNGYRDLPFPFERVEFPGMAIETRWTLAQLVGYIGTWTATRRLLETQPGFLEVAHETLARAWGPAQVRVVNSPLTITCGRHSGA